MKALRFAMKVESTENKQNPASIVANFDYLRELPQWYADTRMKGWNFERAKAKAKDYGIALWGKDKRALEVVTAEILIKIGIIRRRYRPSSAPATDLTCQCPLTNRSRELTDPEIS